MIAEVIGIDDVIDVTPVLDTSAYVTGDRLGAVHTISNVFREIQRSYDPVTQNSPTMKHAGKVWLTGVQIIDQAKASQPMDILIFDALPTVASADNAAIDISDAEMAAKCIGAVSIDSAYIALANNSTTEKGFAPILLKQSLSATTQHLYAVCIIRGSATYGASDLKFKYKLAQD